MSGQKLRLQGIIPPLVTPLSDRDTLDVEGLERLLERIIAGGVHGVFILGTTGEAPSLSYRLRRLLIDRVCQIVKQRVPVLVGITDTSFVESTELAKYAADRGVDAAVLATPYYFPAGQTELTQYIQHVVKELPLPLVLYNMPSLTKIWFDIETLRVLADIQQIIGIKDSGGDLDYFQQLTALQSVRPDWTFMMGPEALLPQAMQRGGHGGVNGGANVFPRMFVDCYEAVVAGDTQRLQAVHAKINAFQRVYDVGKYASRHIKATKCCLSLLGVCDDFLAEPFNRFLAPERERVRVILEELNLAAEYP